MILENFDLILKGTDPNLFAHWSFETLSNELSLDQSGNNNPALFINGAQLGISRADLALDQRPVSVTGLVQDTLTEGSVINGTIIAESTNNLAYFVWGETDLTNTTPAQIFGKGTNAAQATLTGLTGGTTYSFALVVSNSFGISRGTPTTFVKLGWAGYALSLSPNSYIRTVNDQRPFFPDETITVELWVKPKKQGVVLAEVDRLSPANLDSSIIEILASGNVVAGFPGVPTIVIGKADFNAWNHIVLRYNRATQTMDGFVNGIKSQTSSSGDRVAGWEIGRQVTYTFGKSTRDTIGSGESLPAEWDEIRLWNIARPDADILATFNKKLFGTEPGMVAYYRLDDQTASLSDASRHNNPGAITGPFATTVSGAPINVSFTPVRSNDANVVVQFLGIPGREMEIESTTDFKIWTVGPVVIVDSLGIATFTIPASSPIQFFRAKQL